MESIERITMIENCRYPTPEEITAIERAARQLRAQFIAGLFDSAGRALKTLVARGLASLAVAPQGAGPARRSL